MVDPMAHHWYEGATTTKIFLNPIVFVVRMSWGSLVNFWTNLLYFLGLSSILFDLSIVFSASSSCPWMFSMAAMKARRVGFAWAL